MRVVPLVLAVFALAGCGGSELTGSVVDSDVAALAPASALAVIALETDPESEQWQQAERLLERFPGRQRLLDELRSGLSKEGVDAEQDLLPALGDRTYVVFLDVETDENVVVLTRPRDPQKLQELVREADDPAVTREVEGWTLIAETDAALDRFAAGGDRLADADWFADAQGRVEDDALVTFLVNGAAIGEAAASSLSSDCEPPEWQLDYAAGTVSAEEHGLRFAFASEGEGGESADGESLLSRVPSGALLFLGFPGFGGLGVTDQLRCTTDEQGLPDGERFLGVSYEQLGDLFAGGFALSVSPSALVPEATLLLAPEDEAAAVATLDRLAERAVASGLGQLRPRTVDGIAVKELEAGPVTVLYGGADGRVAITTTVRGLQALTGELDSLSDDDRFRAALDAAGVDDGEDVVLYLDLQQLVQLADGLAGLAEEDVPADVEANLEPLRSFLVWADLDDPDDVEAGAFLELR